MRIEKRRRIAEDAYLLIVTDNYVVVNKSYDGLVVMDIDLNMVKSIELPPDTIIYTYFKYRDELLLFCDEGCRFLHVNIDSGRYSVINSPDGSWICSPLYTWEGACVSIYDYGGRMLEINTDTRAAQIRPADGVSALERHTDAGVIAYDGRSGEAILKGEELEVVQIKSGTRFFRAPLDEEFHDYVYSAPFLLSVGEARALITDGQNRASVYPDAGYMFLRGAFYADGSQQALFLLSSDKSNAAVCCVDRLELPPDWENESDEWDSRNAAQKARDKAFFAAVKYSLLSFAAVFVGFLLNMVYEQLKHGLPLGAPVEVDIISGIGFIAGAALLHKARGNIEKKYWFARFFSGTVYVSFLFMGVCMLCAGL